MAIKTEELKDTTRVAEKNGAGGIQLLNDHFRNHDTAFTAEERRRYGLEGFLPHAYESLERQAERVFQHLDAKTSDLEQYVYLTSLADRNETLFYHTVMSDPARFIPILYDPTVAPRHLPRACDGPAFPWLFAERLLSVDWLEERTLS